MQASDAFTPRSTTTVTGVYAPCNTSGSQGENPSLLLCKIKGKAAWVWREDGWLVVGRICPQESPCRLQELHWQVPVPQLVRQHNVL